MIYPWQEKQWQQLWQSVQGGRLPHALLLSGMAGTGKSAFAIHAAQALLCQNVSNAGDVCGSCHHCRLVITQAHPNIYYVSPEKDGHAIKVDQIRELSEFVQQSSLKGAHRFVIINPAHSMNMNAANALLKTLEEPASGAVIILISDQISHLPATIRSRCQRILFQRPDQQIALKWLRSQQTTDQMQPEKLLRLAHGAPLAALSLIQDDIMPLRDDIFQSLLKLAEKRIDPLTLAAKWQKLDPVKWMDMISAWAADLVRLQFGAKTTQLTNQDYEGMLNSCAKRMPVKCNLRLLEDVLGAQRQMQAGINFNKQLLLESVLIRWAGNAS
ncbi:MAG TPA: DNA polymerase III subunit delta' [Gammaproteobacteria bacterium]|jgi:DNA polymerase-3 subunit delta'|nr:DNA polymerase III subunit delta' [Gammaproteobacteria bacterium]